MKRTEQKKNYVLIGIIMAILGLLFLCYMGSSLYQSHKRFFEQFSVIEVIQDAVDDEEV